MSASYPRTIATFTGGVADEVEIKDVTMGTLGRVVFQVVTSGSWDGVIRVSRRIQGAGRATPTITVPWVQSAYRNETGQADVDNTTDITAANIYSVFADGTDIKLSHSGGTTGTATILQHGMHG